MNRMVSLSLGAETEAPPCIIDGSLALSPLGLMLALRLARCRRVWLVRALLALLDNDEFYKDRPELIGDAKGGRVQAQMLSEWRRAWLQANLLDRFCWVGDARHESLLPGDVDEAVVERFELLSQSLEARSGSADSVAVHPISECARDAVVLAAVLGTQSPVILTAPGQNRASPYLCKVLNDAGITCKRLRDNGKYSGLNSGVFPASVWFTTRQLSFLGLRMVAFHLVAPRAIVLDRADCADGWSGDKPLEPDPWADACALWHNVG